jgi:hypothetical protein
VRATWLTPQIIQALARLEQTSKSLTADGKAAGEIIIQNRDRSARRVRHHPQRRGGFAGDRPPLAPLAPRDRAYELFWLAFPNNVEDGQSLFSPTDRKTELSIQIQAKVGKTSPRSPTISDRKHRALV